MKRLRMGLWAVLGVLCSMGAARADDEARKNAAELLAGLTGIQERVLGEREYLLVMGGTPFVTLKMKITKDAHPKADPCYRAEMTIKGDVFGQKFDSEEVAFHDMHLALLESKGRTVEPGKDYQHATTFDGKVYTFTKTPAEGEPETRTVDPTPVLLQGAADFIVAHLLPATPDKTYQFDDFDDDFKGFGLHSYKVLGGRQKVALGDRQFEALVAEEIVVGIDADSEEMVERKSKMYREENGRLLRQEPADQPFTIELNVGQKFEAAAEGPAAKGFDSPRAAVAAHYRAQATGDQALLERALEMPTFIISALRQNPEFAAKSDEELAGIARMAKGQILQSMLSEAAGNDEAKAAFLMFTEEFFEFEAGATPKEGVVRFAALMRQQSPELAAISFQVRDQGEGWKMYGVTISMPPEGMDMPPDAPDLPDLPDPDMPDLPDWTDPGEPPAAPDPGDE